MDAKFYIKNLIQNSKSNGEDDIQEVEGNSRKLFTINDTPSHVMTMFEESTSPSIITIDEFINFINDTNNTIPDIIIFLYNKDNIINNQYKRNIAFIHSGTIASRIVLLNEINDHMSRVDNNCNIEVFNGNNFNQNQDKYYYCYTKFLE